MPAAVWEGTQAGPTVIPGLHAGTPEAMTLARHSRNAEGASAMHHDPVVDLGERTEVTSACSREVGSRQLAVAFPRY